MSLENFSDTEYNTLLRTLHLEYFKKIDDENTRLCKENHFLKSIVSCMGCDTDYIRFDEFFRCKHCNMVYCGENNDVCMSYFCACDNTSCCNNVDKCIICFYCNDYNCHLN